MKTTKIMRYAMIIFALIAFLGIADAYYTDYCTITFTSQFSQDMTYKVDSVFSNDAFANSNDLTMFQTEKIDFHFNLNGEWGFDTIEDVGPTDSPPIYFNGNTGMVCNASLRVHDNGDILVNMEYDGETTYTWDANTPGVHYLEASMEISDCQFNGDTDFAFCPEWDAWVSEAKHGIKQNQLRMSFDYSTLPNNLQLIGDAITVEVLPLGNISKVDFDFGDDGSPDREVSDIDKSILVTIPPEIINDYLASCVPDEEGFCTMPVTIKPDDVGVLELADLDIIYKNYCEIKKALAAEIISCWHEHEEGKDRQNSICKEVVVPRVCNGIEQMDEESFTQVLIDEGFCETLANKDYGCGNEDNIDWLLGTVEMDQNILIEYIGTEKKIVVS